MFVVSHSACSSMADTSANAHRIAFSLLWRSLPITEISREMCANEKRKQTTSLTVCTVHAACRMRCKCVRLFCIQTAWPLRNFYFNRIDKNLGVRKRDDGTDDHNNIVESTRKQSRFASDKKPGFFCETQCKTKTNEPHWDKLCAFCYLFAALVHFYFCYFCRRKISMFRISFRRTHCLLIFCFNISFWKPQHRIQMAMATVCRCLSGLKSEPHCDVAFNFAPPANRTNNSKSICKSCGIRRQPRWLIRKTTVQLKNEFHHKLAVFRELLPSVSVCKWTSERKQQQ